MRFLDKRHRCQAELVENLETKKNERVTTI